MSGTGWLGSCHGDAVEADFENGRSPPSSTRLSARMTSTRRSSGSCSVREAPISPAVRPIAASSRPTPERSRSRGHVRCVDGSRSAFVHYFVRNKQLFNFVTAVEQDSWTGESWTDKVDVATALAEFEDGTPGTRHHRRGRRDVHLGAFRPPAARTMVGRAHDAPRRCLPSDAAVHGPRRCTSDRGRRNAHGLPRGTSPRTSRWHSIATSSCGYPAPHVFKRGPLPTRRASTSRTAPNKRNATHRWRPINRFSKSAIAWIYEHDPTKLEPRNGERTRDVLLSTIRTRRLATLVHAGTGHAARSWTQLASEMRWLSGVQLRGLSGWRRKAMSQNRVGRAFCSGGGSNGTWSRLLS